MSEKSLFSGWNTFSSNSRAQLHRLFNFLGHGAVPKTDKPVRIGVLGASQVATYALIWPAKRLADVKVVAVAARDPTRASKYAATHGISRSYGSYEELIKDPELDAIYVATPNGLHGEWTIKSLEAGKHVLCEKPFTANCKEARRVQAVAKQQGLMCREAFHYREHPANQEVARLIQSGAIGALQEVLIPEWVFRADDIRFNTQLAGGTMMDAGCYCAHALRFFPGCPSPHVVSAEASDVLPGGVDTTMAAVVQYPGGSSSSSSTTRVGGRDKEWPLDVLAGAVGRLHASLKWSGGLLPVTTFTAEGSRGRIEIDNFIMPFLGHTIKLTQYQEQQQQPSEAMLQVQPLTTTTTSSGTHSPSTAGGMQPRLQGSGQQQEGKKGMSSFGIKAMVSGQEMEELVKEFAVYGSQESNYYYQLERFVRDLQVLQDKSSNPSAACAVQAAMEADEGDAVSNMAMLDNIYTAAGLPLRLPTAAHAARAADANEAGRETSNA